MADWVEHYRRFWEQRFDRLDEYLQEMKKEHAKKEKKHGRKQRRGSRHATSQS